MNQRLLTIKASNDVCADEIKHLSAIAGMLDIEHCAIDLNGEIDSFEKELCDAGKYDFLYLGAHANTESFGESDGCPTYAWDELALALCSSDCLNYGSVLMLGCCRGGLKEVAYQLFCACDKIDYICGPRWTVTGPDISAGFHVYIYNHVVRREQPSTSIMRASKATGYDFLARPDNLWVKPT